MILTAMMCGRRKTNYSRLSLRILRVELRVRRLEKKVFVYSWWRIVFGKARNAGTYHGTKSLNAG